MDPLTLSGIFSIGGKLIDKIFPDPEQKAKAQLELLRRSRIQVAGTRGPDLAHSVPLPKNPEGRANSQLRHWAAFTLSGPGF